MHIERDDLSRPEVQALLREHLSNMYELSPPESVHALDVEKLRSPDITFWTVWDGSLLLGCGALKELSPTHGEVKSMRTPKALRGRGAGRAVLTHIIGEARARGYQLLLAHRRDRLEVVVKARDAHPELPRQAVDPQRLVEVPAEPLDGFRDAVGGAAQERQVTEPGFLFACPLPWPRKPPMPVYRWSSRP